MKPYALFLGPVLIFAAGLLLGANVQPRLTGDGYLLFPENATPATLNAASGALKVASGGANQNLILSPSGSGSVQIGTSNPPLLTPSSGALTVAAAGSNQNITLKPSGTGIVRSGDGSAADVVYAIDAAAAQNRVFQYRSNGSVRWSLFTDNTAESGANAGSDLRLNLFDDTGTFIARSLFIKRSTGNVALGPGASTSPGFAVDVTGDVNASGVFRQAGTAGITTLKTILKGTPATGQSTCTISINGGIITASTC